MQKVYIKTYLWNILYKLSDLFALCQIWLCLSYSVIEMSLPGSGRDIQYLKDLQAVSASK